MKIILTESQVNRLVEANTPLDTLNNYIHKNLSDYKYEYGFRQSYIQPTSVVLEGDLSDGDITVRVSVGDVFYNGEDVTEFAKNYALYSGDYDNDTSLAYDFKNFITNKLNKKILSLTPITISEFDIILDLY